MKFITFCVLILVACALAMPKSAFKEEIQKTHLLKLVPESYRQVKCVSTFFDMESQTQLPIGTDITLLLGVNNESSEEFNSTYVIGALSSVNDPENFIQTFDAKELSGKFTVLPSNA
eukprot:TRINITY_DN5177_c0_g1_i1.p1 TRINITY_DN5177_c0_g1~~TRINITY_DN5177_c0_g1_i1.p1  ORF type:complete len:128 (-),score=26.67 TRINITY_DN5177_c0_g1_i1:30-380(-)